MIELGKKIRYFRKRGGLSQFKLEDLIGASAGSLSRIENGEVNPTKETVEKIIKILGLNLREENYLIGKTSEPADEAIIKNVLESIKLQSRDRKAFFCVRDERWRVLDLSASLIKIIGYSSKDEFYKNVYKKTLPQLFIDETIGIRRLFDSKHFEELLNFQLFAYYREVGFMVDDDYYLETIKSIKSDNIAKKIWQKIIDSKFTLSTFLSKNESLVYFNLYGYKVKLLYSRRSLFDYPNFEIIEFHIENPILRKLFKLFNL